MNIRQFRTGALARYVLVSPEPGKYEKQYCSCQLDNYGKNHESDEGPVINKSHQRTSTKPGCAIKCVIESKSRGSSLARHDVRNDRLHDRTLDSHTDTPKDHAGYRPADVQ